MCTLTDSHAQQGRITPGELGGGVLHHSNAVLTSGHSKAQGLLLWQLGHPAWGGDVMKKF